MTSSTTASRQRPASRLLSNVWRFERKPETRGLYRRTASREYEAFKEYYDWAPGRSSVGSLGQGTCVGPVSYKGQAVLDADLANMKAALQGVQVEDVFVSAIAATYVAATRPNEYYKTHEEYEFALADALREEYAASIAAGYVVQLDDPRIITYYTLQPDLSIADCRKWAEPRVEALNYSIRGLPEDSRSIPATAPNIGPRVHEMELVDFIDIMPKINAYAYSFEAANPRHEHEYRLQTLLPDGRLLIRRHQPRPIWSSTRPRGRAYRALRPHRRPRERHRRCGLRLLNRRPRRVRSTLASSGKIRRPQRGSAHDPKLWA